MATVYYPAIIEKGLDSFGVYFPDLPGCVSAGTTAQEAAEGAQEALEGHLSVMSEYGDPIPEPSAIDAIHSAEGSVEVARLLVAGERPGRAVRVQITIEDQLLAKIDRVASNRSRFLAEAAREKLSLGRAEGSTSLKETSITLPTGRVFTKKRSLRSAS